MMDANRYALKDYVKGQIVEINMKDVGWVRGTVEITYVFDYGLWVMLKLDDGRPALCGNASCIRKVPAT